MTVEVDPEYGAVPPGTLVRMLDGRGTTIQESYTDYEHRAEFTIEGLEPATYLFQVILEDDTELDYYWHHMFTPGQSISVAPNPVIKGIDDCFHTHVVAQHEMDHAYHVTLTGWAGDVVHESWQLQPDFDIEATHLDPGSYLLSVEQPEMGMVWRDSLHVGVEDSPLLHLSPNPATYYVHGELHQHVPGYESLSIQVKDAQGMTRWTGSGHVSGFEIPLGQFPAGLYRVIVFDGRHTFSRNFTKF